MPIPVMVGASGVHVVEELTGRTDGPMPSIWQLLKKPRKIGDLYSISFRVQGSRSI